MKRKIKFENKENYNCLYRKINLLVVDIGEIIGDLSDMPIIFKIYFYKQLKDMLQHSINFITKLEEKS